MKTPCLPTLLLLLFAATAGAQSGSLDSLFGTNGTTTTSVGGGGQDFPTSAALQPDGKIVVAGASLSDFTLLRFTAAGQRDSSFGVNGVARTDFGGSSDFAWAVILQPDGKILAGGHALDGNYNFALARYLPEGVLDSTFGTAGKVITNVAGFEYFNALALQTDGKIIGAGRSGNGIATDFTVIRYNPDGTIDSTFDTDGIAITSIAQEDEAIAVAVQPDGKIVAAGFASVMAIGNFALTRYNPDGSLDEDFGTGGIVSTDPAGVGNSDLAKDMLILPDGKILVAGNVNYYNLAGTADIGLVQYNPDGSLDENFGTGGVVIQVAGDVNDIWSMARHPDGMIFLAGQSDVVNGEKRWLLARFQADGDLDTDFGDNGLLTTDFPGTAELATAVLIQPDSKVVLSGRVGTNTLSDFAVARYITDFSLSATIIQAVSCYGEEDGIISIEVSGGVPPYQFSINGVNYQASNTFSGLAAGTYAVTVQDSNGDGVISTIAGIVVPGPDAPPAVTADASTDTITVLVGGPGTFLYSIDGGITFLSENQFTGLANGNYAVVVQDENGCTIFDTTLVVNVSGLTELATLDFALSPNPGSGVFQLKAGTATVYPLQIMVHDLAGRLAYTTMLDGDGAIDLRFLDNGNYLLRVLSENKEGVKQVVIAR